MKNIKNMKEELGEEANRKETLRRSHNANIQSRLDYCCQTLNPSTRKNKKIEVTASPKSAYYNLMHEVNTYKRRWSNTFKIPNRMIQS